MKFFFKKYQKQELLKIASSGSFFECIKQFVEEMFDKIENVKSYLKSNELMRLFNETKAQSIANVSELSIRFI